MGQHKNKPNNSKKKPNGLRKRLNSASNMTVMLIAGVISIELMYFLIQYFPKWISLTDKVQESAGYWNFLIVLISVPVALVVWHFRDENNRQQIENQRKDINLKEFQKLSEWVSGAHLPEIKTVSKTTQKSSSKDGAEITEQTTEQSEEYSKKPDTADFDTFSKREGAVALQISAIYNLLPFFRGDYGESFRRPAFNLLKSAWQAMQQDSLKKLDGDHLSDEERKKIFDELTQKAKSPMGVALTQVLLSLNREYKKLNLRDFPEMLPNICFAGMDFQLSGVDEIAKDLSGLKLQGANFQNAILEKADLETATLIGAEFHKANLTEAKLKGANLGIANFQNAILEKADLETATLIGAEFQKANLTEAKLKGADLRKANFQNAILEKADLETADLFGANLHKADLTGAKLKGVDLRKANFQNAILEKADLETANLFDANLHKANFQNAILEKADLETANLFDANLHKANLTGAKLKGADLRKANFQNACLVEADLQNANLSFANLKECDLKWEQLKYNEKLFSASITILDFVKSVYPDWKGENDSKWDELKENEQTKAMQKFCDETGMLIFDKSGTQIMPPP